LTAQKYSLFSIGFVFCCVLFFSFFHLLVHCSYFFLKKIDDNDISF